MKLLQTYKVVYLDDILVGESKMFQLPEWGIGFVVDFILSIVFLIILPLENMKIRCVIKIKSFTKIYKNFFAKIFLFDSYLNIIEIDNLVGLEKLQKLQLDNNIICKI